MRVICNCIRYSVSPQEIVSDYMKQYMKQELCVIKGKGRMKQGR